MAAFHGNQLHHQALARFSFTTPLAERPRALHSRSLMLALSYLIEAYAARTPAATLIAAFQRFSFVRPQLERYTRLAPNFSQAYVIGFPDVELPELPNVSYVPIEASWPLMHEWVVIAYGPAINVALIAYDDEQQQPHSRSRAFEAIWTVDPAQVEAVYEAWWRASGVVPPQFERDTQATIQTTRALQQEVAERIRGANRRQRRTTTPPAG